MRMFESMEKLNGKSMFESLSAFPIKVNGGAEGPNFIHLSLKSDQQIKGDLDQIINIMKKCCPATCCAHTFELNHAGIWFYKVLINW